MRHFVSLGEAEMKNLQDSMVEKNVSNFGPLGKGGVRGLFPSSSGFLIPALGLPICPYFEVLKDTV